MKHTQRTWSKALLIAVAVYPTAASGAAPLQEPPAVTAQEAELEADEAIARLKSPFCPGLMLEVCPTDSAAVLREGIQDMARSGMSANAIVDQVVAERGEVYRALPKAEGKGLLAWLIPPLAILLGVVLVVVVVRKTGGPALAWSPEDVSEADEARVRAALEALER